MSTFADLYNDLFFGLFMSPVNIECRNKKIAYELTNLHLRIDCSKGISIFSHKDSRVFPVKFALAELAWILSGSDRLEDIVKYNKTMAHFSDDGITLYGAYGARLRNQIEACINKLEKDKHSRQAFCTIYDIFDVLENTKDLPCNTSLQFLIRNNQLDLIVNSRSSDFITGFPIDAFHWQTILWLVYNSLHSTHNGLNVGKLVYNITSLHVYDTDKDLVIKHVSKMDNLEDYSYVVNNYNNYSHVVNNVIDKFKMCNTVDDLSYRLKFDVYNDITFTTLHTIFTKYKNALVR